MPDTVWKKAYEEEIVQVIIALDKRFSLDTEAAVTSLERELVGTQYRLRRVGRGWTSMEVGVGALQVLDASSLVVAGSENIKLFAHNRISDNPPYLRSAEGTWRDEGDGLLSDRFISFCPSSWMRLAFKGSIP